MKTPEHIWIQSDHIPDHVALDQIDEKPDADEAHQFTSYTRTDVAQAQVAAAYLDAGNLHQSLWRENSAYRTDQLIKRTHTDAKAALDRIVQEAVKEALENARGAVLAEKLFDEISTSDHRAHNAALDSAVQAIADLKGGAA